jgi:nicotinamidase-related amidase
MPLDSQPEPIAPEAAADGTALLLVDMISCWDFPDADRLLPGALAIAPRLAALKARCRDAGVPVIYANDNRGRWRSDFRTLVEQSLEGGGDAAAITRALLPGPEDYFVLKPSQSAFFATPLELLLQHLEARRIVIAGVASDQCVLASAMDAGMRSLEAVIPSDCVATQDEARHQAVLRQFEEVHRLQVVPAAQLRLPPAQRG